MPRVTANRWVTLAVRAERAIEQRVAALLRDRPRWQVTVVPYVGHGTGSRVRIRGRALVRRREPRVARGRVATVATAVARYLSVDVPAVSVAVEVGGRTEQVRSGAEGYLDSEVEASGLAPGWHCVTYRPEDGAESEGRLLVVDPTATLGVVSDLDDTVLHTGLTRLVDAVRTTLLVADHDRVAITGGAELYQGLVADGRTPVFYVSTGAWNLHTMLVAFLERNGFPAGPITLTDWGPGLRWLFREDSVAFKTRTILGLLAEHPQLSWVLVGDSGQHDAETYAQVVRAHPEGIRAVYIRDVPPGSPARDQCVHALAAELAGLGVPMLLVRDSLAAAEHAHGLGLVDAETVRRVRAAVGHP